MSIEKLPNEVLYQIMQYLPVRDHLRARRVCRRWNQILYQKCFMKHANLLDQHLHLKSMWKIVRYQISPHLLTLKIRGYAFAVDGNKGKSSVSKALLRQLSTRCPDLWLLHLTECRISSISFEHLPASITCLEMVRNKWQHRWLKDKQMHLPNLEYLNLDGCILVDDLDLEDIAMFKNLKYLSLNACFKIGEHGVKAIAENLSELKVLNLFYTSINGLAVLYITEHLKKLEELCLASCKLSDICLTLIARGLPLLNKLDISFCDEITMDGLRSLFGSNLSFLIARHAWYTYWHHEIEHFKMGFPETFTFQSF